MTAPALWGCVQAWGLNVAPRWWSHARLSGSQMEVSGDKSPEVKSFYWWSPPRAVIHHVTKRNGMARRGGILAVRRLQIGLPWLHGLTAKMTASCQKRAKAKARKTEFRSACGA